MFVLVALSPLLALLTPRNSLASASGSNAMSLIEEMAEMEGLSEDEYKYLDLEDFSSSTLLELFVSRISGPGFSRPSSPSDASPDDIQSFDASSLLFSDEDFTSFAIQDSDAIVNAIRYNIVFNGSSYTLLLSPSYIDQIYIDSDGYLWNMGTSSIQGRAFSGTFNPTSDTGYLLYLNPCLGNNFSSNHNYGSPNFLRRYYWSSGSLRYSDTYGVVHVKNPESFSFFQGDTLTYIIIFILGGILLCLWKKSRL